MKEATAELIRVRQYLRARGSPKPVVSGGLPYLLQKWEKTIAKIEDPNAFVIFDEYLEWVDTRARLEDILSLLGTDKRAEIGQRIGELDRRFVAATEPSSACIWGGWNAGKYRFTAETTWWYYRVPKIKLQGCRQVEPGGS
jgi:hypothetical protein